MLSTKLIKPSSPTRSHLRTLKLSPIDQLFTYTVKPSAICYYSADSSSSSWSEDVARRNRLETSLSETLTRFYPLAGGYIKGSHSVDCNDEGVEYLEAKVEGQLSQLLSRRDEMIYQLVRLSGGESTSPVASIQIGVRIHHIVVDGFTAASFVSAWATASREGIGKLIFRLSGWLLSSRRMIYLCWSQGLPRKSLERIRSWPGGWCLMGPKYRPSGPELMTSASNGTLHGWRWW